MSSNSSAPDYRAKEAQLIISLKFHYGTTLGELPLDVAVDAMVKVWESCQPKTEQPQQSAGLMSDRPRKVAPPNQGAPPHKVASPNIIHL